jgi:hypothetical protein
MTMTRIRWEYHVISAYVPITDWFTSDQDWMKCSRCNVKPRVWIFDNGRFAKCLCAHKYGKAQAEAISINEGTRNNSYDHDELRKNWNHYVLNQNNNKG